MRSSTVDKNSTNDVEVKAERNHRRSKTRIETNSKSEKNRKTGLASKIFTALFSLGTIGIIVVLFLLYGPYSNFREWLVTTAMTTMTHQYFATWFYDEDTIAYILDKNRVIETNETPS